MPSTPLPFYISLLYSLSYSSGGDPVARVQQRTLCISKALKVTTSLLYMTKFHFWFLKVFIFIDACLQNVMVAFLVGSFFRYTTRFNPFLFSIPSSLRPPPISYTLPHCQISVSISGKICNNHDNYRLVFNDRRSTHDEHPNKWNTEWLFI